MLVLLYCIHRKLRQHKQPPTKMDLVLANCSKEDPIYPLTVKEITQAQSEDATLKKLTIQDKYFILLLEVTLLLCKDGKMVIPKVLQIRAVSWYHHLFLQLVPK